MNAPGVLAELNDYVAKRLRGDDAPAHIINLTLLPQKTSRTLPSSASGWAPEA